MNKLHALLKHIAIGYEGETTLVQQIAQLLIKKEKTLSVVESCTGGKIAEMITAEAGVSAFFKGSMVTYATEIKSSVLGVDKDLINRYSVVSKEVVEAMAIQANKIFKTDFAISTTGNAGPTKGDADDEVGTVYVAIAGPNGVFSEKYNFGQPRERVIGKATFKALGLLQKEILKN